MSSGWCTSTCGWRGTSSPWMALTGEFGLSCQSQAVPAEGLGIACLGCLGSAAVWQSLGLAPHDLGDCTLQASSCMARLLWLCLLRLHAGLR